MKSARKRSLRHSFTVPLLASLMLLTLGSGSSWAAANDISGKVIKDVDGDSNIAGPQDVPLAGVRVYLYRDINSNNLPDNSDVHLATAITDNSGNYAFQNALGAPLSSLPNGTYWVIAETASIDSLGATIEQTYGPAGAMIDPDSNETTETDFRTTPGAAYGGRRMKIYDSFSSTNMDLNVAEHVVKIQLDGAAAHSNVSFGFGFIDSLIAGLSDFYIPGNANLIWETFESMDDDSALNETTGLRMIASVTTSTDNTVIFYDHWEDGLDFNPDDPYNTADEIRVVPKGGKPVIFEKKNIPVKPRGNTVMYDFGDAIHVAGGPVSVNVTMWPESIGTVFSSSWVLYPSKPFQTSYTIPGEALATGATAYADFTHVLGIIQATEDGTVITATDANGNVMDLVKADPVTGLPISAGTSPVLNAGESVLLGQVRNNPANTTVNSGTTAGSTVGTDNSTLSATIIGSKPIQVNYRIGNPEASGQASQSRGITATPDILLDDEYYLPVSGRTGGNADAYFTNSNPYSITIHYESTVGSGSFVVPAGATRSFQGLTGGYIGASAYHFKSEGNAKFNAIASFCTENPDYDWGINMVPSYILRNEYYLGWAPGGSDYDTAIVEPPYNPTRNYSPAWITPKYDDTTVYVDANADGIADGTFTVNRLQSLDVRKSQFPAFLGTPGTKNVNHDNSGMRIWATGPIAVAWGQDSQGGSNTAPGMDLGYTVLPLPMDWMDAALGVIKTTDSPTIPAQTNLEVKFTLAIPAWQAVSDLAVTDLLPPNWTYKAQSTAITSNHDGLESTWAYANTAKVEPVQSVSGTRTKLVWDVQQSPFNIYSLDPNEYVVLRFTAVTPSNPADIVSGYNQNDSEVSGLRDLDGDGVPETTFTSEDSAYVYVSQVMIDKDTTTPVVMAGENAAYTLTVQNNNSSAITGITLGDELPVGFTYVAGSASATLNGGAVAAPTAGGTASAPTWNVGSIAANSTYVLTFQALVGNGTAAGSYDNDAWITGTGIPKIYDRGDTGEDPGTITSGGVNQDQEQDEDVTVIARNLQAEKGIIATSEVGTDAYEVAVGEIVRYRVQTQLPEASVQNFYVHDHIVPGMMLLENSVRVSIIDNDGNITITDKYGANDSVALTNAKGTGTAPYRAVTSSLPDDNLSSQLASESDDYTSTMTTTGTDVYFKIGDIFNVANKAHAEYVVIEYDAVVLNTTANQQGKVLDNYFTANVSGIDSNADQDFGDAGEKGTPVIDGAIDWNKDGSITAADDGILDGIAIIDGRLDLDKSGTVTTADDGTFRGIAVIDGRLDIAGGGTINTADDGTLGFWAVSNIVDVSIVEPVLNIAKNYASAYISGAWRAVYTVTVSNTGTVDAYDLNVTDQLDNVSGAGNGKLDIDAAGDIVQTASTGTVEGVVITPNTAAESFAITIGRLAANSSATFTITADYVGVGGNSIAANTVNLTYTGLPGSQGTAAGNNPTEAQTPGVSGTQTGERNGNDGAGGLNNYVASATTSATTIPGAVLPAAINGKVYSDDGTGGGTADDGTRNGTEPGIANVTVTLISAGIDGLYGTADDVVIGTTTTDGNGDYNFPGLAAGNYRVDVDSSDSDLNGKKLTSANDPKDVVLAVGETQTVNFGFNYKGVIGNTVFNDNGAGGGTAYDGVQNGGETGIAGVNVTLIEAGPDGQFGTGDDVTVGTKITNASGNYSFDHLPAGKYRADVDQTAAGVTGKVLTTGNDPQTIYLGAGVTDNSADFGFAAISLNVDKISSAGGMANPGQTITYTVNIENTSGTALTDVAVSDAVPAGTTYVAGSAKVVQGATLAVSSTVASDTFPTVGSGATGTGWVGNWIEVGEVDGFGAGAGDIIVADNVAANPFTTSELRIRNSNKGAYREVNLAAYGTARLSLDYQSFGTLATSDNVTLAASNDGIVWTTIYTWSSNGTGSLSNIDLTPYIDTDTRIRFIGSGALSAANGLYVDNIVISGRTKTAVTNQAARVPLGILTPSDSYYLAATNGTSGSGPDFMTLTYQVTVNDPLANGIASINNTVSVTTSQFAPATVTDSVSDTVPTYDISGQVRLDADNDGDLGDTDSGLAGASVALFTDPNGDGNPADGVQVGTVTTTGTGGYTFSNVVPGKYVVVETNPSGYTSTADSAGANNDRVPVTLTNANSTGNTFLDTNVGTISGQVRLDADNDGNPTDADSGINGVTLSLYTDPNGDGNPSDGSLVTTATTSGTGNYTFPNVPPGSYVIVETNPAGHSSTYDADGTASNTLDQIKVTLANSGSSTGNDFLDSALYSVSGQIRYDSDNDGDLGDADSGLAGASVALFTDPNGDGNPADGVQVGAAVTTTGTGNYTFPNVVPGKYVVVETSPASYISTADSAGANDDRVPLTVTNADSTGNNFLDTILYSVSGQIRYDSDNDGNLGDADNGLAGASVALFTDPNGDGNPADGVQVGVAVTTTGTGNYTFPNVVPGKYVVVETNPAGYISTADSAGANDDSVPLTITNANSTGNNFLDAQIPGVIGNRIWLDEDGNGLPDAGEAGISGVTVYVDDDGTPGYSAGDSQTVTDSNGNYLLKDLPPGTHTVRVKTDTLPAGLVLIYDEDSGTGSPDGTTSVNLSTGKSHLTADFGYNWVSKGDTDNPAAGATGAIGDRIWNDADGDGVQDSGEIGIVGVTVKLFTDTNGDGVYGGTGDSAAVTTTTGADGRYIFDGLTPGSYVIEVDKTTLPAGYNTTPSSDPDSTRDGKTTNPIILSPGDVFVNADFGYNINNDGNPNTSESGGGHSIGNTIYLDADASGTLTAADSGIAGITVVLEDSSGKIIATTTTDASGSYSFDGLPDGTYTVKVADNSNLLNGLSSTGYPSGGSAYQNSVTLSGADKLDQDFGYAPAGHSSSEGLIGDTVFLDLDNDGIVDAGEGIEGVTVQLYDSTGTTLLQTVVTDQNGQYRFGNINKTATYQVRVNTTTLPNGGAGLNNSVDPDGGTASRSTVNLSVDSDGIVLDQDFGYVAATPNTISGTLWNDTDADGTLEGSEAGRLSGVTIVLHDSSGRIVATTVTDGSGNYSFGNLPNGVYTVDVEDRNGSLEGWWHSDGPNDGVDNNSQVSGYSITVSGAGNSTADFGYYKNTASVGDHIWKDADGDGIFAGEEPMIGQKVSLVISYPNGDKVTVTTVTDATGHYTFATLLADEDYLSSSGANQPTYVIQVEPPTDMRSTHTPATDSSGLDDQANNPEGEFVSLNKGEDVVNKDFAFYFGGAIGDHVWLDIDGDGVQDGNEAPLDGVIVKLYLDGGNGALGGDDTFTTSAVTGIDGSYLFENLPAGTYWVQIDSGVPAGLEVTADGTHENIADQTKPADKVVLPANGSDNTVDFGFSSTAMLGDAIWFDADPDGGGPLLPDGLQNPGEAGIAGVGLFICENDVNPCNGSNDIDTSSTGPTVTTGIDGTWLKTGFTPSATYTVAVDTTTLPAGLDSVPTNGPVRRTYTLPTSGGVLLADYGFADDSTPNYGSIGNRVYFDTDNDSTDDGAATDPGIAGVLVDLLINDGGTWKTVAQTTTGADGKYLFSGLLSGTDYRVQLNTSNSSLADFTATQAPGAGYYTYNSNINGLNYLAADYGFSGTGIGDYVWFDSNSDGIQNGAETGIGGVEVKLYLDNGSVPNQVDAGDTLIRTTTTDSSGHYLFSGVATGQDYVVKVTPPSNFTPSSTGAGTVSTDSNGNANNEAALNFTGTTFDLDFGFKGGTYSIGDFVWLDSDGQGDQDESSGGINGVTVDLYLGGIRIASTVTSGGGHYSFSNLSANTYEVRITDEGNILDNLIATTGGESKTVTLSAGNPAANDIDFGYNYPIPTYALISSFKAYVNDKNQTVLEWKTDSEVGTIGFLLERLNKQRGEYEAISDMLPGMLTPPQGGTYRYVDTAAASDKQHTYRVVEVAVNNQGSVAGPYTVKAEQPLPVSKAMVANSAATGFSLAQQSVTAKQLQRFAVMEQAAQSLATEQKQKTGTVIKLPVAKEGLVYLTAEQLAAASGLKPLQVIQHLKAKKCLVTLQGKAVPALFSANGAALWFYGQTPTRNDIGRNTYWLELGKKGVTISVAPQAVGEGPAFSEESFIDRIKVEENHLPIHLYINKPVNDFWAWKYLLASGEKASSIHSVITPDFAGSGTAMLAVNLVNISSENSGTAAPYKVTLFLNGVDIGMAETTTTGDWQIRKPISASLLRKTNEVKIVSQLNTNVSYSLIYLDSIEMEYQRKYQAQQGSLTFTSGRSSRVITEGFNGSAVLALDITDPDKPVRVRAELDKSQSGSYAVTMPTKPDHRYFVTENISPAAAGLTADTPSSLRSTANQADYLIISPLHLLESAKRLADRRQSQGLTAMVVDIEDVQDEFSHGLAAPEAVHEFLTYVHAKWAKSPRYVALAGDGSYDYRNYLGYGWPLVPSLLVATPEGFFPSDNALADVVGDDGIPEFAVGRIPVFDKAEFEKYIDKVISYEQTVHAAGKKLVVVNDKTDAAAGDFKASADLVANLKPEQMAVMRLDVNTLGYTAVGDQIKATMQQGIGILHYIGHSSLIGFGKSNSLLSASKIDALNPVGSPLLMVSMSCSAASFGYPVMNSIGESAVLRANGAAVGFYGATGLSKNYLADIIAEGFYRNLADPSGTHRIGDAVFQSKQHYVEVKHGHDTYMLDIYNLLGDPAVQMTTQQ